MPTTPPKSDQGSDRQQPVKRPREVAEEKLAPGPPDPEDPDRGHWPYDCGCTSMEKFNHVL